MWPVDNESDAEPVRSHLEPLATIGNPALLDADLTALFCSQRCPGDVILKLYDLARAMRHEGVPVIGGFQTPMERECLRILLRGDQPIVICPSRGIENMRIPREWREPLDGGRLLILSPFPPTLRRPTAASAAQRNELVASLAKQVLIAHAASNSKTESFAHHLAESGKTLLTLGSPANADLAKLGAETIGPESVSDMVSREWEEHGNAQEPLTDVVANYV